MSLVSPHKVTTIFYYTYQLYRTVQRRSLQIFPGTHFRSRSRCISSRGHLLLCRWKEEVHQRRNYRNTIQDRISNKFATNPNDHPQVLFVFKLQLIFFSSPTTTVVSTSPIRVLPVPPRPPTSVVPPYETKPTVVTRSTIDTKSTDTASRPPPRPARAETMRGSRPQPPIPQHSSLRGGEIRVRK
jgi:hypothetical protein